jgi:hypothetical protein
MIEIQRTIQITEAELNALGYFRREVIIEPPPNKPTTITKTFEPGDGNVQRANVGGLKNLGPMRVTLTEAQLREVKKLGFNLAKWPLAMPRDRKLPDGFKQGIRDTAKMAMQMGIKLAIRPQYHQMMNGQMMGFIPDMSLVEAHIPQVGELFEEIMPALAYTEAGYLGQWAEWHGDPLIRLPDGSFHYANAKKVFDLINEHYPKDLHKLVRYCRPLVRLSSNRLGWFDWDKHVNADTESPQNKWGLHNDFYAAGGADASTFFPDRGGAALSEAERLMHDQQKSYLYKSAQWVYYAGEPVPVGGDRGRPWDVAATTPLSRQGLIAKVKADGMSTLNLDGQANMRQWMQQEPALYQELLNTLGYNLYTERVSVTVEGKKLTAKINWGNTGSSGVLNKTSLQLFGGGFVVELSPDIGDTTPRGGRFLESEYTAELPDLARGKHDLGLSLEDKSGLQQFATQLNNKDAKFEMGVNDLGMTLEI